MAIYGIIATIFALFLGYILGYIICPKPSKRKKER